MAKLIFRYGAMGSSKTANALMVRYNYYERDKKVVLLKPRCEDRDGAKVIKSRIGLEEPCEFAEDFLENYSGEHYDCIMTALSLTRCSSLPRRSLTGSATLSMSITSPLYATVCGRTSRVIFSPAHSGSWSLQTILSRYGRSAGAVSGRISMQG